MKNKKPMIKETVGALYLAFNTPDSSGEFNTSTYEETIKSDVVKKIATTENAETTVVRASGQDYKTVNQTSSIEMAVEVVAFDPATLARMRGDDTSDNGGLILSGAPAERPFFAFGKVVKKVGGGVQYAWYPKCQLVENTDEIETSGDTFAEQNDTITIKAYSFNNANQKKTYVDSETANYPQGLTEVGFFTKPIINAEDLAAAAGGASV